MELAPATSEKLQLVPALSVHNEQRPMDPGGLRRDGTEQLCVKVRRGI